VPKEKVAIKGNYNPEPKRKRRATVALILAFLGLGTLAELTPAIAAQLAWKTAQDVLRDLQTAAIKESGVSLQKDWVTHPEESESGVCDYCQEMADAGPYPIEYDADTHPNCKCEWVPHIE
jgi:hypothetical protein